MKTFNWRSSVRLTLIVCALGAIGSTTNAQTLPQGWTSTDVGSAALSGAVSLSSGVYSVSGAGADIWGTADQFFFVHRQLTGDGTIVARVASVQGIESWIKAGVMMRESLAPGSRHAFALVSKSKGLAFQRRASTNGSSTNTSAAGVAPRWVKLQRSGSLFTASQSADGIAWTPIGSNTIAMNATIYVGLAVTSHRTSALGSAAFTNVEVSTPQLPEGWHSADIGFGVLPGSATHAGGVFTIEAAGRDIWTTADEFRFTYLQATGDVDVIAHVDSIERVDAWTKAGVMMRASLDASSSHASMFVSPAKGLAFQRRPADGASSVHTSGGSGTAPRWVKLSRRGATITAYQSMDSSSWQFVGTQMLSLPNTFYVGLAVSSHNASALATVAFSGVDVPSAVVANEAPTVTLTSPLAGLSLIAPATIDLAAAAADRDGTITRVDFFSGTTLLASDTSAPYSHRWSNVLPGVYTITAVATDTTGVRSTSTPSIVTVIAAPQPPSVSLTSPTSGASFTAPASMVMAASASDVDGSITRVDFYAGASLVGTDATSPYSISWSSVPEGTYSVRAVAWDNTGASTTSAPRSVTVTPQNQAPYVALTSPASGASFAAPASLTLAADATDADGTIARVEFYNGTQLLASDTTAPYSFTWGNVPAGNYSITAVARDNSGSTTVSGAVNVTVNAPQMPNHAVFTPSSNHDTAVDRYIVEFFYAGADPNASNPVSTADVGKPAIVNGQCQADVSQVVNALTPGAYIATVTAVGPGGSARSAASPQFTR